MLIKVLLVHGPQVNTGLSRRPQRPRLFELKWSGMHVVKGLMKRKVGRGKLEEGGRDGLHRSFRDRVPPRLGRHKGLNLEKGGLE